MKKFVLLGKSRTGSSLLINSLKQHPDMNVLSEIFNWRNDGIDKEIFDFDIEFNESNYKHTAKSHDLMCYKKYCKDAHKKYDGFKLLFCHLKNDVEEYLSETDVFLLYRKNLLKRFVSQRVAFLTDQWFGGEPFTGTVYIRPDEVETDICQVIQEYERLKQFSSLNLFYENSLFDNVNKTCDYLDIKRFTPKIYSKKRIDRPMSEVLHNYEELKQYDHENYF